MYLNRLWLVAACCILLSNTIWAQWSAGASGSANDIFSVQMIDAATGYWAGVDGLAKTLDSGQAWGNINNNNFLGAYPIDLHFFNTSTGVISVANDFISEQQIWYTADGGATYSHVYSSPYANFISGPWFAFPNPTTGYAVIAEGEILQTTNGGQAWSAVSNIGSRVNYIFFTSPTVGYLTTNVSIFKTTNSGFDWTAVYTDSSLLSGLSGVYFTSDSVGYVSDADGAIFKTVDAGNTWIKTLLPGTNGGRFYFLNADTGFLAGGAVLQTTNGGQSWEALVIGSSGNSLGSINFNSGTGVTAGTNGALYFTTHYVPAPAKPFAVFTIASARCDTVTQFANQSYTGYTSQWYFNGQYVSNAYNYTHPMRYGNGYDTVSLVVSNGTYTDTFTQRLAQTVAPVLPSLNSVHFTADTICANGYICIGVDSSVSYNNYVISSNGVPVYTLNGVNTGLSHCINYIFDTTRVVVTMSNTGSCTSLIDSVVKEVYVPVSTIIRITLLDSIACADGTVRLKLDNTSSWFKYFVPGDTVIGSAGSVYLNYTLNNNAYDTVYPLYVVQQSLLNCGNIYGTADSIVKIHIRRPAVAFTAIDSLTNTGVPVNLQNLSKADSYIWYFDSTANKLTDTAASTTVLYNQPGEKQVMLIANTIQHCDEDTLVKYIFAGNTVAQDNAGATCFDADIDTSTYPAGGILAYHVDEFGNTYAGGYGYSNSFNGADYNTATYCWLRKTDKSGNTIWYKTLPANMQYDYQYYSSYITGITSDATGNVYIAGSFGTQDNFQFDSISLANPQLIFGNNNNGTNFFAMKFDSSGADKWMIASYQNQGASFYLGATDIKYADDGHLYLSVVAPNSGYHPFSCTVQYTNAVYAQNISSLNVIQLNSNGEFIKATTAENISLRDNSNYPGNIWSVFNPNYSANVSMRNGIMGPRLFLHADCSVSVVGFFVDSINFGANMGVQSYTSVLSAFTANMDPVQGWQYAHTLYGTTFLSPEFSTLIGTYPYDGGYADWMPRFDFDSHKNLYIATHIDSLYLKDTITALNLTNYAGVKLPLFTIVAKFDASGKNVWFTQNRNYTNAHHITGVNLSPDESEIVLTGYYSNGINLASTHQPPSLLLTHLAQAPFIAAMDTGGDVKWINSIGTGGIITNVLSNKTCTGNIYTLGLNAGHSHQFKYNLYGNCTAPDTCTPNINCNAIAIALTTGTLPFCGADSLTFTASAYALPNGASYRWFINGVNTGNSTNTLLIGQPLAGEVINCVMAQPGNDTLYSNTITITKAVIDTPVITQSHDSLVATSGTAYAWYLNGVLTGANTQAILITANGSYTVTVTDTSGCSATSLPFIVATTGLGIITANNIKVYPTPNNGTFIIETANAINTDMVINDMYGNRVYGQLITSNKQTINVPQLAAGVYMVGVKLDDGYRYFKIVREVTGP